MYWWHTNLQSATEINIYNSVNKWIIDRIYRILEVGLRIRLLNISRFPEIPVVLCVISGKSYPYAGFGISCNTSMISAICKSIDESVSIRTMSHWARSSEKVDCNNFDWVQELPDRAVQAESAGELQGGGLGPPVHDLVGADARMPVDVLPVVDGEVAGQVGNALLEGVEVADLRLGAAQRRGDGVEHLRVDVLHEHRVEAPDLVDRVELVDHPRRVAPDDHVELLDVVEVDRLPQQGSGPGQIVDLLQDPGEGGGEGAVEVGVAEHGPGVAPPDRRAGDAVTYSDRKSVV